MELAHLVAPGPPDAPMGRDLRYAPRSGSSLCSEIGTFASLQLAQMVAHFVSRRAYRVLREMCLVKREIYSKIGGDFLVEIRGV